MGKKIKINDLGSISILKIRGRDSGSGAECQFYASSKSARKGYKVYGSYEAASFARNNQIRASRKGLGPKAGKLFAVMDNCGCIENYGYETQVAREAPDDFYELHINRLIDELAKINIDFQDAHEGNVGIINRRLVCIDFGEASVKAY